METYQKMSPKQHLFLSGKSCLFQLLEHHNKILEELEKSNNVDVIYLDFEERLISRPRLITEQTQKIGINCKIGEGYTIFNQTDDNVLPSMEQHQVRLKSEVAYHKGQC